MFVEKKKNNLLYTNMLFSFMKKKKKVTIKKKRDCHMKECNNYTLSEEVFEYNKKSVVKDYFTTEETSY